MTPVRTATVTRYYDDFAVFTPAAEPIVLYSGRMIEIRHDSTERESSAGSVWGRPQSYRGSRFKVPPAGDANRTTRVAVKASRNDLDKRRGREPHRPDHPLGDRGPDLRGSAAALRLLVG